MPERTVLFAIIGLLAATAAVTLWLAASGVGLWPESKPAAGAASAPVTASHAGSATVERDGPAPIVAAAPAVPETNTMAYPQPAFDPARFGERCMTFARRTDSEPGVLAADQRMCDCFGKTLKPADYAMMLDYTQIDAGAPDASAKYDVLYRAYGMSAGQYATELNRIRGLGKACTAAR